MKINPVYFQTYNLNTTQTQKQNLNGHNPAYAYKYAYHNSFTGSEDMWQKAKKLGKEVVNKTKENFSEFSSLFKNSDIKLSKENFIDSYIKKEEEIKAEYDKKIAEVKDGIFENWTGSADKKRRNLREQKEKALKVAYKYQEIFEEREKEAIANKEELLKYAKQVNASREILATIESSILSNQRRLDIIKGRKAFTEDKGFNKIAGYEYEKNLFRQSFLDLVDDERAGKFLTKPIPNAILFYGPTGCGKTTFVNALAEETDCYFIKSIKCIGPQQEKEKQLHNILIGYVDDFNEEKPGLLEEAQNNFLQTGKRTIILIDEFDRFFGNRVSDRFKNEMKSILENCSENNHVTFFLTTNRPQIIPYELINSHRIELAYPLDPPNKINAAAVIEYYLKDCKIENLDYDAILERLFKYAPDEIYSNTHLKTICERAKSAVNNDEPLTTDMFLNAIDEYDNSNTDHNILRLTKKYLEQYNKDKANL